MHGLAQLVSAAVYIEVILIFIRILISWFPGIPPWHPMVRILATLTDPILLPFRRLLPTLGGLDFSPIVAIVALQVVGRFVVNLLEPGPNASLAHSLTLALQQIVDAVLIIFVIIVLLRVVVSFMKVSPFHPAVRMIRDMSSPLVRPFSTFARRTQSADIPAIIALVVYFVLYQVADRLLGQLATTTAPIV
jgi:YggT family protein